MRSVFFVLVSSWLVSGCATVLGPRETTVMVSSSPDYGRVVVDGKELGKSPAIIQLDHKGPHQVVVGCEGQSPQTFEVRQQIKPIWIVLDVVFGLVPLIIDAATGAWNGLDRTSVAAAFLNVTSCGTPPAQPPSALGQPSAPGQPAAPKPSYCADLKASPQWLNANAIEKRALLRQCQ